MGLLDIFKKKETGKKELYEKETKQDEVFGNITRLGKASSWYTEKYSMNLFNNEWEVWIAIEVADNDSSITDSQHFAGKEFIKNLEKYQDIITKEVMKFFNTNDFDKIYNSIIIDTVRVSRKGNVCMIMNCREDADETLFSGLSNDIAFTDTFGIEVYPEVKMLPNEEEVTFNAFDY